MLHFNFHPFPEILTERLILRRIRSEDMNEMYVLKTHSVVNEFLDRDPPKDPEEMNSWLEKVESEINSNKGISWGIGFKNENKLIGTIGLWRTIPEHHRAEIGYSLMNDYWKQGIMSEAMIACLEYGFNEMKLHSIEANVNPNNKSSIAILEKFGFEKEAHFKENYFYNDNFLDSAIYSLLEKNYINHTKIKS